MSTHSVVFLDLTKLIFDISSHIIKYAPYFFCCESNKEFRDSSFPYITITCMYNLDPPVPLSYSKTEFKV